MSDVYLLLLLQLLLQLLLLRDQMRLLQILEKKQTTVKCAKGRTSFPVRQHLCAASYLIGLRDDWCCKIPGLQINITLKKKGFW
jgi:hypothetical protein